LHDERAVRRFLAGLHRPHGRERQRRRPGGGHLRLHQRCRVRRRRPGMSTVTRDQRILAERCDHLRGPGWQQLLAASPCTSPDFPSCAVLAGIDICDFSSRVCNLCLDDEQCVSSVGSGGPVCDGPLFGLDVSGTAVASWTADCPAGDSCISDGSHSSILGICVASFSRCMPESCGGFYCNWDSGACVEVSDIETFPSCVSDADCEEKVCWEGSLCRLPRPARCTPVGQTHNQPCLSAADCSDGEGCQRREPHLWHLSRSELQVGSYGPPWATSDRDRCHKCGSRRCTPRRLNSRPALSTAGCGSARQA